MDVKKEIVSSANQVKIVKEQISHRQCHSWWNLIDPKVINYSIKRNIRSNTVRKKFDNPETINVRQEEPKLRATAVTFNRYPESSDGKEQTSRP